MSSRKTPDVDFERDMPLTDADLEALDRARRLRPLPTMAYLEWLTLLSKHHRPHRVLNTDADEPFTL
jgi:hypothetical protein